MTAKYSSTQLQGISDLVVVAPIKLGVVEGALDSITYRDRLEGLLRLLNQGRLAARESSPQPSPFSDLVGRLGIIHFFRFAIIPPLRKEDPSRLLLNVTFDGGWEPYMRIVWRDLGPLLDVICCHCDRYPIAHKCSFDEYIRWVREHEAHAGFFYTDSGETIGDQIYNAEIERLCRNDGTANLDSRAARHRIKTSDELMSEALAKANNNRFEAVAAGLRAISAFHSFARWFPGPVDGGDAGILLRFVKALLPEFLSMVSKGIFKEPEFVALRAPATEQLDWFMRMGAERTIPDERLSTHPPELVAHTQVGVLKPYPEITHGCLTLLQIDALRVTDVISFIEKWPVSSGTNDSPDGIFRSISFTHTGLAALGVSAQRLALFPQDFIEGMEARAGVLGDTRCNHPQQWQRPSCNWPPLHASSAPVELSTVHIVVQLRTQSTVQSANELLPEFEKEIKKLEAAGLIVLAWQPMRRYPHGTASEDHFGFADGFSQPTLESPAAPQQGETGVVVSPKVHWSDQVKAGDLMLGFRNSLDDGPDPVTADLLLDKGSFLVVRKLRQYTARFEHFLETETRKYWSLPADDEYKAIRTELKERMMGRRVNGDSLVSPSSQGNNFNFLGDASGDHCPFRSHVRRTNPRTPGRMPRIMRRGMSYGSRHGPGTEQEERGVVFMAYNASIAEQFEVIQRWVAGGNSSGVSSEQNDPFLGISEPGRPRMFRCSVAGRALNFDLGKEPFVQLRWGLYLFAPSVLALREFKRAVSFQAPAEINPKPSVPIATTPEDVLEVLTDRGATFSVRGYGDRLSESVGNGHLGQDLHDPDRTHAEKINELIMSIGEKEAFGVAHKIGANILDRFLNAQQSLPALDRLSLEVFIDQVLGLVCREWFGLPDADGIYMRLAGKTANPDENARCPGHFYSVARFVFSPAPSVTEETLGKAHGRSLLAAALKYVNDGMLVPGKLSGGIAEIIGRDHKERIARTIVGVMLGFPPTTGGNLLTVLVTWLKTRELWNFQMELLRTDARNYDNASQVLLASLLRTMRQNPVPLAIWRTALPPCKVGGVEVNVQSRILVALGAAIAKGAHDEIMFGRAPPAKDPTAHGCPGRSMALGVMLGIVSALLWAGQLQSTGDSTSVILRRF